MDHSAKRGGRPPVSAHPAFPAIVALWFAALFGLGSLIVPVQLVERVVTATGLAALVPEAAPPLGFTARAAIALVATVLGALLGLVAARRVVGPRTPAVADMRPARGKRSKVARETYDEDDCDEPMFDDEDDFPEDRPILGRRRALAMDADEDATSTLLEPAPLPGNGLPAYAAEPESHDDAFDLAEAEELADIEELAEIEEEPAEPASASEEPRQEVVRPVLAQKPLRQPQPDPLPFSPPSMLRREVPAAAEETAEAQPFDQPAEPATQDAARPFDAPSPFHPSDPEPTVQEPQGDTTSEDPVSDIPPFEAFARPLAQSEDDPPIALAEDFDAAPADAEPAEHEGEGLVQLVQRLGSTLERHRAFVAERQAAAAAAGAASQAPQPMAEQSAHAAPPVPEDFDPAAADDAAEAMAAYFSRPGAALAAAPSAPAEDAPNATAPMPGMGYAPFSSAIRVNAGKGPFDAPADDLAEDDEDLDGLAASFSLPLGTATTRATPTPRPSFDIAPPAPQPAPQPAPAPRPAAEVPASVDRTYGSLSGIENPFKRGEEFVRIEEPEPEMAQPAVQFPNEEARRPAVQPAPTGGARPFDPPSAQRSAEPQHRASNDDNERALREALLNLQRMSK
ncbi:hypothetical protein AAW00_08075 [Aurantiacibacter luteus]|uniref:Uncharacterized protein n=2 Tax=Aurantiacibacter luteus TaxID=1581420 RepID=A0A0G9MY65_9SPHN|nr:hypothetical protein AAW00_08075 [Aurantiacibacter luteus]